MITINSQLDMTPGAIPVVIHRSQYDSDFSIVFTLFARTGNFTIASGTTAKVRGTKKSGTGYSADATVNVSAKTVTVTGDQQMTVVSGQNIFEIVLMSGTKELCSANFILDVERAALDMDTITDDTVARELDNLDQFVTEAEAAADRAETAAESVGRPTDAQAQAAVNNWLGEHPEATTTVQDGAITEDKLTSALKLKTIKDYVTPEMFGAAGDGVTDDTQAVFDAIANGDVLLSRKYLITSDIYIPSKKYITGIGYESEIILKDASIVLDGVESVQLSDIKVVFSRLNTKPAFNIADCRFSTFRNLTIESDQNFSTNAVTGININCLNGKRFSLNTIKNITIRNCETGLSMSSSGTGYITSNYFDSIKIVEFTKNAIVINGGKIYTNVFFGTVIQDSFASGYDRYGITQQKGYKNDFIDVVIWADARTGAGQFTALNITAVSVYSIPNLITGYIEGLINFTSDYDRIKADFTWIYVDSVNNTSENIGFVDNTNKTLIATTEWDNVAKNAHAVGSYFITKGTTRKAVKNIAVGDTLIENDNYINTLMGSQLSQKDILYTVNPTFKKVTKNNIYCYYNGRSIAIEFDITTSESLAGGDDIITKLPKTTLTQMPLLIYDVTSGEYVNALIAGDNVGTIVRIKQSVQANHNLRFSVSYITQEMR